LVESEKKSFAALRDALLQGYTEFMPLTQKDIDMIPYFLLARKLCVVAWLESRKDNPRLKSYFLKEVKRTIKFFKEKI